MMDDLLTCPRWTICNVGGLHELPQRPFAFQVWALCYSRAVLETTMCASQQVGAGAFGLLEAWGALQQPGLGSGARPSTALCALLACPAALLPTRDL